MKTKTLSHSEYHPLSKPFSLQEVIKKRVQMEDEAQFANDYFRLPENITYPKVEVKNKVGIFNFIKHIIP